MTWVKICGTTSAEDAKAAIEAGADALGFIFAPSSRRIEPRRAREIIALLPRTVEKVGVFVNEPVGHIREMVSSVGLTAIQLHGDETPDFARSILHDWPKQLPKPPRMRVFKAVAVATGLEKDLRDFVAERTVDALLLDSAPRRGAGEPRGGTGRTFNWTRATAFVPGVAARVRVILAGGLTAANVGQAIRILNPWGVDVCSGVESERGKKDYKKLREFVHAVRNPRERG